VRFRTAVALRIWTLPDSLPHLGHRPRSVTAGLERRRLTSGDCHRFQGRKRAVSFETNCHLPLPPSPSTRVSSPHASSRPSHLAGPSATGAHGVSARPVQSSWIAPIGRSPDSSNPEIFLELPIQSNNQTGRSQQEAASTRDLRPPTLEPGASCSPCYLSPVTCYS